MLRTSNQRTELDPRNCRRLGFGVSLGATVKFASSAHFTISYLKASGETPSRRLHAHDCADFLLPLDCGFHSEAAGFEAYRVGQQMIYTPPGVAHRDSMERLGGRFITISASNEIVKSLSDELDLPDHSRAIDSPDVMLCAYRLAAQLSDPQRAALALEGFGNELLGLVATPRRRHRNPAACVQRGVNLLSKLEPGEDMSLCETAKLAGAHPVYFARAFRRRMGCTPSEFAMRIKVMRAACRLQGEKVDLATLASECGFFDQSHLSKCFKKILGTTPGRYRSSFR